MTDDSEGRRYRPRNKAARRAKGLSIVLASDVDEQVRALADENGSTIARAMDMLIRDALKARAIAASRELVADRLEKSVDQMETLLFGRAIHGAHPIDEQRLLGLTMAGHPTGVAALKILKPRIFAYKLHQLAWELLADGKLASPGKNAVDDLAAIIGRQISEVVSYAHLQSQVDADEPKISDRSKPIPVRKYLADLTEWSQYFAHTLDVSLHLLVHSFIARSTGRAEAPDPDDTVPLHDAHFKLLVASTGYRRHGPSSTPDITENQLEAIFQALRENGIDPDEVMANAPREEDEYRRENR